MNLSEPPALLVWVVAVTVVLLAVPLIGIVVHLADQQGCADPAPHLAMECTPGPNGSFRCVRTRCWSEAP